jgi:hypothetical protein
MRRILGILLLVLTFAACGSDTGGSDSSGEDSTTVSQTPTVSDTPAPAAEVVEIVSETAAGGRTGDPAVRIDRPAGLAQLTRDFSRPALADKILAVVQQTDVPTGQALYGQVIAIGCDVPPSASVEVTDGKVVIMPGKVADPMPECFAPVTSVAIALVDLPLH